VLRSLDLADQLRINVLPEHLNVVLVVGVVDPVDLAVFFHMEEIFINIIQVTSYVNIINYGEIAQNRWIGYNRPFEIFWALFADQG